MPAQLMIVGILVISLIALPVMMINGVLPLFVRNDFDYTCDKYLKTASIKGGLDSSDITSLKNTLRELGYTNIIVTVPSDKRYGEDVTLKVVADYNYKNIDIDNDYNQVNETRQTIFEVTTKVFGEEN